MNAKRVGDRAIPFSTREGILARERVSIDQSPVSPLVETIHRSSPTLKSRETDFSSRVRDVCG